MQLNSFSSEVKLANSFFKDAGSSQTQSKSHSAQEEEMFSLIKVTDHPKSQKTESL